jgi:hypothetical protein
MSKVTATIIVTIIAIIGGINLYVYISAKATDSQITSITLTEREEHGNYESVEYLRNGYAHVVSSVKNNFYMPRHKQGWYVVTNLLVLKKLFTAGIAAETALPHGSDIAHIQKAGTWREAKINFDDQKSIYFLSSPIKERGDSWTDELFSYEPQIESSLASEAAIRSISNAF